MKKRHVFIFLAVLLSTAFSQNVSVSGGTYLMGSRKDGETNEKPSHEVSVSSFEIQKYEVSYTEYMDCVRKGGCTQPHYNDKKCIMWSSSGIKKVRVPKKYRSEDYPVVCVSWKQARQYCRVRGMKLPTEAQWEYAAGGYSGKKYSVDKNSSSLAGKCCYKSDGPCKRGIFPPNGKGLYDMTGNVWEWTYDRYQPDYYKNSRRDDPQGPSVGRYRSIRGGGWYSSPGQLRIQNRQWFIPEYGEVSVGIRCVK